ncbi:hypothetical protein C8Q74DRAFT_791169 [Fomes fomentarius]|nr:hypothetical protein C8Q74DRAFT_791169 [Fomes fomentarius]
MLADRGSRRRAESGVPSGRRAPGQFFSSSAPHGTRKPTISPAATQNHSLDRRRSVRDGRHRLPPRRPDTLAAPESSLCGRRDQHTRHYFYGLFETATHSKLPSRSPSILRCKPCRCALSTHIAYRCASTRPTRFPTSDRPPARSYQPIPFWRHKRRRRYPAKQRDEERRQSDDLPRTASGGAFPIVILVLDTFQAQGSHRSAAEA